VPINPTSDLFEEFRYELDGINQKVIDDIKAQIKDDVLVTFGILAAVNHSFAKEKYSEKVIEDLYRKLALSYMVGSKSQNVPSDFIEEFPRRKWTGSLSLSQRIHGKNAQRAAASEIKNAIKNNRTVVQLSKAIDDRILSNPDGLAKHMDNVIRAFNKNAKYMSAKTRAELRRAVRMSQRSINMMSGNNVGARRLKKAYQNIINKIEAGNREAIQGAIERGVNAKSRYVTERIARTEMARAYGRGTFERFAKNPTIQAYRSTLSSAHRIYDICDVHAQADLYGLGPGVYPKNVGPSYPYHPQCRCILSPVYGDAGESKTKKMSDAAMKRHLSGLSAKEKEVLLGKHGTVNAWKKNLRNWNGHVKHLKQ